MRAQVLLVVGLIATLSVGCGRTQPLFYASDAGVDVNPVVPCVPGSVNLVAATPVVMLVLDRSGSMAQGLAGGARGESKWQSLTLGLADTLPAVNQTMQLGALLFPSSSALDECSVPTAPQLAPATGNVDALLQLMSSTEPGGSTPTSTALQSAAAQLLAHRSATGARALVLATDGAPNCNPNLDAASCVCGQGGHCHDPLQCLDETRTVDTLSTLDAEGLPTYVIGLQSGADAQFDSVLDAMANAGGRPRSGGGASYYAASSDADLDSALTSIRDQVGACLFLTTSVPNTQGTIVVTLDGQVIPEDPSGANGWSWADRANGEIVLLGNVCSSVTGESAPNLVSQVTCVAPDAGAMDADAMDAGAVDAGH